MRLLRYKNLQRKTKPQRKKNLLLERSSSQKKKRKQRQSDKRKNVSERSVDVAKRKKWPKGKPSKRLTR